MLIKIAVDSPIQEEIATAPLGPRNDGVIWWSGAAAPQSFSRGEAVERSETEVECGQ